jgi:hypothetical protein
VEDRVLSGISQAQEDLHHTISLCAQWKSVLLTEGGAEGLQLEECWSKTKISVTQKICVQELY